MAEVTESVTIPNGQISDLEVKLRTRAVEMNDYKRGALDQIKAMRHLRKRINMGNSPELQSFLDTLESRQEEDPASYDWYNTLTKYLYSSSS
ncbi:MAG: hypothetical protein PVI03_07930, partial [Candidatus Thorarchaeota archaeon]